MVARPQKEMVDALYASYADRAAYPLRNPALEEIKVSHRDGLDFIADCRRLGLTILGMDFYVTPEDRGWIQPDGYTDYSTYSHEVDASERSCAEALAFIKNGLPEGTNLVSFVVDDS